MRWQGAGTQGTGGSDGQTDYGIDPVNRTSAAGQGDSAIPGLLAQLLNRSGRWKIEDGRSKIGGLYLLTPISHLRCYLLTPIFDLLSANYHLLTVVLQRESAIAPNAQAPAARAATV